MEFIRPGKYVEFTYNLFEIENGEEQLMFSADKGHPDKTIFGVDDSLLPAVCDALENKTVGDTFDITLKPEEAFGEFRTEHIMDLDKEIFHNEDGVFDSEHVHNGAPITMMTADGHPVSGLVLEVGTSKVKIDFNHPLAGKTVRFTGEVLAVRDATEEELHPSCGCGCGHDCGDGGCSGCGDGCCH